MNFKSYLLLSLVFIPGFSCSHANESDTSDFQNFFVKSDRKAEEQTNSYSEKTEDELCSPSPQQAHFDLRHKEARGIGYKYGYTTLEAFVLPNWEKGTLPYLDVRGHVFNNGRFAANAGIGVRHLGGSRIYGGNVYYDFRNTKKKDFHQAALGLETLGIRWDFFANGYLVVGKKRSSFSAKRFDGFQGHHILLKQRATYAFSGVDAEARFHFLKKKGWDLYLGMGPYYFTAKHMGNAIGGQATLAAKIWDYFSLQASTSYDAVFKWIGQGSAGLIFPLGKRFPITKAKNKSCKDGIALRERLIQIPDHNEIIPIKSRSTNSFAIDPDTGLPYFFVFVDNTSSSNGTIESPYPSLLLAQNNSKPGDIIYVFPGDGTMKNMSDGIILQDNQLFLGSGLPYSFPIPGGNIVVPAQTSNFPTITNTAGDAVTLANNNRVSGFHITQAFGSGISGIGIANATIQNNIISHANTSTTSGLAAIYLEGPGLSGTYIIQENAITGSQALEPQMRGIFVASSGNDITFLNILNNTVDTPHNCLEFKPFDNSVLTSVISGNDFISRGPGIRRATFVDAHNSGKQITTISYNSFSVPNAGASESALLLEGQNPTSSFDATIIGNIFHDSPRGCRINAKANGANNFTVNVLANRFQNNTTNDFLASMGSTAANSKYLCLALNGNIAPDLGFALTNDNTAPLTVYNVRSALFNIGDIVESGAGTITHNPICPPSPLP